MINEKESLIRAWKALEEISVTAIEDCKRKLTVAQGLASAFDYFEKLSEEKTTKKESPEFVEKETPANQK